MVSELTGSPSQMNVWGASLHFRITDLNSYLAFSFPHMVEINLKSVVRDASTFWDGTFEDHRQAPGILNFRG